MFYYRSRMFSVDFHACLHNCALLGMWEYKILITNKNDLPKKQYLHTQNFESASRDRNLS